MSTLYLVSTPIGNLEDISLRALRTLREVERIAAEDTRQTKKLLAHYDIHTPLISYHEHSRPAKIEAILKWLEVGDVALVSDAGTPGINDPGYGLVQAALQAGHRVSPIPGPSAPIAALVASGLPTHAFLYLGYLPRKKGERQRLLRAIASLPYTLILLETPHRLLAALADLQTILGERQIAVARELTKLHEEVFRGSLSAAHAHFTAQPPRGEFTLVVAGAPPAATRWSEAQVRAALETALARGQPPSQAARQVASQAGWDRGKVYNLISSMENQGKRGSK